jgi:hypothetical protein
MMETAETFHLRAMPILEILLRGKRRQHDGRRTKLAKVQRPQRNRK